MSQVIAASDLPSQFRELEPYVKKWAVEPLSRRQQARTSSSFGELKAFYDAMMSIGDQTIEYLNRYNLDALPAPERNLLNLMLSLMEVAHSVELWGGIDQSDAFAFERIELVLDR
jgi:hypothetical protein